MLTQNEQRAVLTAMASSPLVVHKLKTLFAAVEQITGVLPDAEPAPAPELPRTQACAHIDYGDKHSFAGRFFSAVQNILGEEITHENMAESFEDTGVDDLDRIEMVLALEEEFEMEIPDYSVDHFKSFADMYKFVKDRHYD
ncbi:hypothetical protein LU11_gp353 [Pseudomonas phage Lu11]|uniref:hypothetical protein n=1 Tax=Pseudomonas phage Lu11 TaxID=1161927 RepID=UPI00025F18BE|nr:hypothetical protein LU11_gp353 [Pseudomonas phage Lu11]AFH14884.1 hypothetical protein Lu11_0346 [Pseudomonas phage Lu11]